MNKRRQKGRYFRCGTLEYRVNKYEFSPPRRPAEAGLVRGLRAAPGRFILIKP
jgi:hypothetical protein